MSQVSGTTTEDRRARAEAFVRDVLGSWDQVTPEAVIQSVTDKVHANMEQTCGRK